MTVITPTTGRTGSPSASPSAGPTPSRVLARVAAGSAAAAAVAIALAGLLDPGYSRVSEAISALASKESGSAPVMIVGFIAMALTLLASGAVLFGALPGNRAKVGAVLVVLAGLLTVVVGFARQDCSSLQAECLARESANTVSSSHWIHNLVSLPLFLFLAVAAFLWTAALRRAIGSRLARVSLVVAIVTALFLVWFGSGAYGTFGGLVERVLVWLAFGWPAFLALRVTRSTSKVA